LFPVLERLIATGMDLELTPDQDLLRETTRKFLTTSVPLTTVRLLADDPSGFGRGWWEQGAELGWTSLLVDEEHGGGSVSGQGLADLALIAEEMGALVSPGPLIPTNVIAQTLSLEPSDASAQKVLAGLLSGAVVAAWCAAEPGRSFDPAGITLRAERDGDEYVLDGVKSPVEAGAEADWLLVTARQDIGLSQFLVPAAAPGVRITRLNGLDLTRRNAEIGFEGVRVPAGAMVGVPGGAEVAFERQLQTALILQCAEIVGATDRVLTFTLQYAFDRSAFGRPLASYQALKHRFADMKWWMESAQAITVDAIRAVQAGSAEAAEVARIAKAYVAERCPELIQDCIQLHGGIGVTWEHDLHLYLRRVVLHRQTYGDLADLRDRVAVLAG
jgi:alkylation response protein AidB-like acyl-CoA dehydrogenase